MWRRLPTLGCALAVIALVACNAPPADDGGGGGPDPAQGEGAVSSLAAAERPTPTTVPAPEATATPIDPTPSSRAILHGARMGFATALVTPARLAPPTPGPSELGLLELMRTEIGPRFGRPDARAELNALLRTVPSWAPPEHAPRWRAIVEAAPESGPLYETCKQCHLEQRLHFRALQGKLPVQSPRRSRDKDRR